MSLIYRDDDVNVYTDAYLFRELHKQFIEKNIDHYVGVLMKDLWENHAIFWYLATAPKLTVCLHGWEHKDYSALSYEECCDDLAKSLDYWRKNAARMTGQAKPIDTFFAPWNREGDNIKKACAEFGLKFCAVKDGEWDGHTLKSFHWWDTMNGWTL
jgi:peptidoglycan/xylan/chitin deacetylase (PgdA/CDA1 family)